MAVGKTIGTRCPGEPVLLAVLWAGDYNYKGGRMKTSNINLATVKGSTKATFKAKEATKYVQGLNGYDALIRESADLLILSGVVRSEKCKNAKGNQYERIFLWVLDAEKGLKTVTRSSLAGGMGYEKANTISGEWKWNQEQTWRVLHPAVNDAETRATFKSWGISHILPESFEVQGENILIPHVMRLKITKTGFVAGKNPVSASDYKSNPALCDDLFLVPFSQFYWEGEGHYATEQEIKEFVEAVKQKFPEQLANVDEYPELFQHV